MIINLLQGVVIKLVTENSHENWWFSVTFFMILGFIFEV